MQLGVNADLRLPLVLGLVLVGFGPLSLLKTTTQLRVFPLQCCGAFFRSAFALIRSLDARMESAGQALGFRSIVISRGLLG